MWTERIALGVTLAGLATQATADYAHAPFHDRPVDVADLALRVLDGEAVAVPSDDVPLAAAVAAMLLISERGLAEAYEEAVGGDDDADEDGDDGAGEEEGDAYASAHATLEAARPWIVAVPQDAELADLLTRLESLMPTPERPASLDADPEAAEVLAQALVGQLERAADADLYLGRDLGRALDTVAGIAAQGCAAAPDARPRLFEVAALYFEDALEAPLSVMTPDAAGRIEDGFEAAPDGDAAVCDTLVAAFGETRERLFP